MAVVAIVSAKGGCGASLVATNLAVHLARRAPTLLLDLHPVLGYDDLLLDLRPDRSWLDLIPVAAELTARHVELTAAVHSSGLRYLAAPRTGSPPLVSTPQMTALLASLAGWHAWLLIDLAPETILAGPDWLAQLELLLLVATGDPPALRGARMLLEALPAEMHAHARLVLNQFGRRHPVQPRAVADSLECPLLAVLPTDRSAVGYQINFGHPCALDPSSAFGRAVASLARHLTSDESSQGEPGAALPAAEAAGEK